MELLDLARCFKHVRELPNNRGNRVEAIQKWCGGQPGDSWCCDFVSLVLDLYYGGKAPFPRQGSCDVVLAMAKDLNLIVPLPVIGGLYLRLNDPTDAHHIGFVTSELHDGMFGQLSGNTSADGLSSNGDGVYERDIKLTAPEKFAFVKLPPRSL